MKKAIPFELEDGQIHIEVEDEDQNGTGFRRVGRGDEKESTAPKRFSDAIAGVKPAAEALLASFKEINTPSEIGLEFGLKFNAKVGAVFTTADSQATFKVSVKWTNKPAE